MTPSGSTDYDPDIPAVVNRSSNYSHEPGRQFRQTVNSLYSAESMNKEEGNEDKVDYVSLSLNQKFMLSLLLTS